MGRRLLGLAAVLTLLAPTRGAGEAIDIVVIIVPPRRTSQLSLKDVAQIYLKRRRFWDDGSPVVPLKLSSGTPLRERFSRAVLRESEARLAEYWNRQYFCGIFPATLASTEAVRRYVASDPNAIGYLPGSEVDGSVRALLHLR